MLCPSPARCCFWNISVLFSPRPLLVLAWSLEKKNQTLITHLLGARPYTGHLTCMISTLVMVYDFPISQAGTPSCYCCDTSLSDLFAQLNLNPFLYYWEPAGHNWALGSRLGDQVSLPLPVGCSLSLCPLPGKWAIDGTHPRRVVVWRGNQCAQFRASAW